jgi:hypothetical protein
MTKEKIVALSLIIVLICFIFIYFYQSESRKKEINSHYQLQKQEIALLKEGDIILRHGYGIISDMIVESTNDCYEVSHCGIIGKDAKKQWIVIHTVSNTLSSIDGMQAEYLSTFIKASKPNSILVVRYKNGNDSMQKQLVKQALYYLQKKIPFDDNFNSKDTSEFYCTELIHQLFIDVYKTDIYKNSTNDIYDFQPFWNQDKFTIILSHQIQREKKHKK